MQTYAYWYSQAHTHTCIYEYIYTRLCVCVCVCVCVCSRLYNQRDNHNQCMYFSFLNFNLSCKLLDWID